MIPTARSMAIDAAYLAESQVDVIKGSMLVMGLVALVAVALRLYVRITLRRFGADDLIIAIAVVLNIGVIVAWYLAADLGLGRHIEFLEAKPDGATRLVHMVLAITVGQTFAIMGNCLAKTSFAVTLLRINSYPYLTWFLWFLIITMNIANILASILLYAQCEDPRSVWNPAIVSVCWDPKTYTNYVLFVGSYSGAIDIILAILPTTMVWNLQMKKKEKVGVAIAMGLGVFAGTAALLKTAKLPTLNATDLSWAESPLLLWAEAEGALTIVAASIPTLRPLLRWFHTVSAVEQPDSDDNSYPLKGVSNDDSMFRRGNNIATVIAQHGGTDTLFRTDNQSQESMLARARADSISGIQVTRNTFVDFRTK
ncbi:hypothetical protein F4780DRAFT_200722 [Xylariomycetidae sp. FL0641]|nr:hypothetical protein F4780DRAFT_200722 [Xylariomycetidae sp. FL0641]